MTTFDSSNPPSFRFLTSHPAHVIALGFGSGLAPFAPGTFGTLLGWALFIPINRLISAPAIWIGVVIIAFLIGCWACEKTGEDLGAPDHGAMVWDEIVAVWLVLAVAPDFWGWQLVAVIAFRFFDILKPPPIRYFDRVYKGGFGVMFDDIAAAFYSLLLISVIFVLSRTLGY